MWVLGFMLGFIDWWICCKNLGFFCLVLNWGGFLYLIFNNFFEELGSGWFFCMNKCFFLGFLVVLFEIFLYFEVRENSKSMKIFYMICFMFWWKWDWDWYEMVNFMWLYVIFCFCGIVCVMMIM